MGKQWKQWQTIFLDSKVNADGNCSCEIKRRLLLGRKAMTNLDNVLKSRDITLRTEARIVKAMVFPVVMYSFESWTMKKAEHQRTDAFKPWCWRRLLTVPWTARKSNQSILREINPKYSLEGLMLKLKLQYFGHLMWRANSLEKTRCWERLRAGGEGSDRGWDGWMASPIQWTYIWANSRNGEGQGSLACCSPWSHRVKHDWATEQQLRLLVSDPRVGVPPYVVWTAHSSERTSEPM